VVDDARELAVVYMRHTNYRDGKNLAPRAKALLRFVMMMQTDDGKFYNSFIRIIRSTRRAGRV